jgi:hypothetical protein
VAWIVQAQLVVRGPLFAGRALTSFANNSRAVGETCPRIQLKTTLVRSTLTLLVA